jgi:predicted RNA-binding Zn ribbon-like protein
MAGGDRALLLDFLNSTVAGTERLATAADYGAWLRERGLLAPDDHPTSSDLEVAQLLRGALRSAVRTNARGEVGRHDVSTLNDLAEALPLRVRFKASGEIGLEAASGGVEGFHARMLAAAYREEIRGEWRRFKLCRNSECEWAFFDESRNRSRVWCEMQICGSRAKMRAYRARRAAT